MPGLGRAMWGHAMVAAWVALFLALFKFALKQFKATAWIAEEF